uniref:Uncharacterized protein n=1 Tax=Arundo donax TaxID=35708 RepID=A0A0A9CDP3_ARUDO
MTQQISMEEENGIGSFKYLKKGDNFFCSEHDPWLPICSPTSIHLLLPDRGAYL